MMMDLQLCLSVCLAIVARALRCLLGSEAKFRMKLERGHAPG